MCPTDGSDTKRIPEQDQDSREPTLTLTVTEVFAVEGRICFRWVTNELRVEAKTTYRAVARFKSPFTGKSVFLGSTKNPQPPMFPTAELDNTITIRFKGLIESPKDWEQIITVLLLGQWHPKITLGYMGLETFVQGITYHLPEIENRKKRAKIERILTRLVRART